MILIFPVIGSFAVSRLKYLQYMATEYFYERADYYLLGKDVTYETMGDYGRRYERKIEAERRRQQEERARMEEEMFRRQFEAFFNQGNFGGYNQEATAISAAAIIRKATAPTTGALRKNTKPPCTA